MVEIISLKILISALVFFVYGSICLISTFFTFFLDIYLKWNEQLNLDIVSVVFFAPIENSIEVFDDWLVKHHRTVGPILIFLSIIDIKLLFELINLI